MTPEGGDAAGGGEAGGGILAGRYRILRKLGEGAMGAVYLGEHLRMGRRDAIKVISRNMAGSAEALARFEREARNASFINHPHVCQIYDFGETEEGLAFLAMEFVEGQTLSDVMQAGGGWLPAERALPIALQTADALEAAHARSIVHRDLKPDNIMLARGRDGGDLVKVVDFGIAKGIGDDEGQAVTRLGFVIGTPEYMSPEQLSGDRLDGRSDIYSLALVLVKLLTGAFPFHATTAQELMLKRLTEAPRPLAELAPGVPFPAGLQEVLDRALARSAADRFPTAAAFGEALKGVLQGMEGGVRAPAVAGAVPSTRVAPSTRDPGIASPPPVPPGAPPAGMAPGASGGMVPGAHAGGSAAGAAVGSVGGSAAGGHPGVQPPAGGGRLNWMVAGGAAAVVVLGGLIWALLGGGGGDPGEEVAGAQVELPSGSGGGSPPPPAGDPDAGGGDLPVEPSGPAEAGPPADTGPRGETPPPRAPDSGAPPAPTGPAIRVDPALAREWVNRQAIRFDDAITEGRSGMPTGAEVRGILEAPGSPDAARIRGVMQAARDTLMAVWETPAVSGADRARAAFNLGVLAEADPRATRNTVIQWFQRAVDLDPGNEAYRMTLRGMTGGGL